MAWSGRRTSSRSYRSGLELREAEHIKASGHRVRFEQFRIPYTVPQQERHYTPDFGLDNWIIVETKGIFDVHDRAKHLLIQNEWPELDIRFVFSNPNAKLYKGSPTSYADWCEAHGFKYASKTIPEAWFKEKGPTKSPAEVLGPRISPGAGARKTAKVTTKGKGTTDGTRKRTATGAVKR